MMGGNKKNKRGSSSSSSSSSLQQQPSVSPTTELIERTPDNDYGVLSDPDEQPSSHHQTNSPTSSDHEEHPNLSSPSSEHVDSPIDLEPLPVAVVALPLIPEYSHILDEQSPTSQSSPQSSPQSPPLIQGQDLLISQNPTLNKSLETLKLKLMRDKNFSRKITLHTFFSYIILAMEIQRSCSSSIAKLSAENVQDLVVYMIENHSSSNPVRIYLHTLNDTGVVKNIIESIIDFNKDNKNSSLESLYTLEENELEMSILQSANTSSPSSATATALNDVKIDDATKKSEKLPQTSQKCGFFKRMRCCLFSGCCG